MDKELLARINLERSMRDWSEEQLFGEMTKRGCKDSLSELKFQLIGKNDLKPENEKLLREIFSSTPVNMKDNVKYVW